MITSLEGRQRVDDGLGYFGELATHDVDETMPTSGDFLLCDFWRALCA